MKETDFDGIMQGMKEAASFLQSGNLTGKLHVPADIDAAAIRARTGLSQINFAKTIGVSVATLRNWEQGRRMPDGSARVLLSLLNKDPNIVRRTLKSAA